MDATPALETLWVGGEGGMEAALVARAGIPFKAIPAAGLHGVGIRNLPRNLGQLARGFRASGRILKEYRPHEGYWPTEYIPAKREAAWEKMQPILDARPDLAASAEAYKKYFAGRR